ncbi:MAG: hypothetical protein L0271_22095 [Gemmatimonadetes bacterium]|nr:hypothetical protein [Gemmatimonadota bacterium]
MDEDIIFFLIAGLIILIPVTGITLRFALKPIVDSIARLMEVRANRDSAATLEQRVAQLEQELHSARAELHDLRDRDDFYKRLETGRS